MKYTHEERVFELSIIKDILEGKLTVNEGKVQAQAYFDESKSSMYRNLPRFVKDMEQRLNGEPTTYWKLPKVWIEAAKQVWPDKAELLEYIYKLERNN